MEKWPHIKGGGVQNSLPKGCELFDLKKQIRKVLESYEQKKTNETQERPKIQLKWRLKLTTKN